MRRTHKEIRSLIVKSLANSSKTINEIASDVGINWKTVELHLTWLKGTEQVKEVFRHKRLRIFEAGGAS